jgi:hypothetical protein
MLRHHLTVANRQMHCCVTGDRSVYLRVVGPSLFIFLCFLLRCIERWRIDLASI